MRHRWTEGLGLVGVGLEVVLEEEEAAGIFLESNPGLGLCLAFGS